MISENVILVNEADEEIGTMEKLEAHQKGVLHRAFSIFVFNSSRELILQQRAKNKYHSGGLWTNTCCGHPRPGENIEDAAHRRLGEEMGFDCELKKEFSFVYQQQVGELFEHELDHVFIGQYDGSPTLNPDEAMAWKNIAIPKLQILLAANPEEFTIWFRICLNDVLGFASS